MEESTPYVETPPTATPGTDWSYPTRLCRICLEDVAPTVTMYPPGVPMQFQTPVVEYKSDDEYGRLIKPCKCRGTLRYIHELCLLRSRTATARAGSMWKCHECGHQFNFKRLTAQRLLSSWISVGILTILFMVLVVFVLGFIADPIINIYLDPYDTLSGRESLWEELEVRSTEEDTISLWTQHFAKGFISMGLVGFLKTILFNPFTYVNFRFGGSWGSSGRGTTGRDRAVAINWFAILVGISTAFVFFYRWVSAIVQRSLQRIGNNIVDTQLPGDDDDLKPPTNWRPRATTTSPQAQSEGAILHKVGDPSEKKKQDDDSSAMKSDINPNPKASRTGELASPQRTPASSSTPLSGLDSDESLPLMSGSWVAVDQADQCSQPEPQVSTEVHRQAWSFSNI